MGAGIAITRGAAGALSFCMAVVLLTVCRNVITLLRETPIGEFIPFDSAIAFHKIVALFAAFWAALHTIGHCVNFYHVATQSQEGLHCLFQEAVFGSNFLPSISYWFYGTITGLTGILLVAVMSIIYVFALPCFMKRAYHAFRLTHLLNVAFYALTVLHGLAETARFSGIWYYAIGPVVIFIIDRIMGMRQEYKKLKILNAELLPSDIIYLQFKRRPLVVLVPFRPMGSRSVDVEDEVGNYSSTSERFALPTGPYEWSLRRRKPGATTTNGNMFL
ncbi:ferric reductase like transmembrane component [Cooperia oncophora]